MQQCTVLGVIYLSIRGQANSIDFMLSITVFTILLTVILGFWLVGILDMERMIARNRLEAEAVTISDLLVKSPGNPEDWEKNQSELGMLGLSNSDNVLNTDKVRNFTSMNYSLTKEYLGIADEYYFYIETLDGDRLYESGNGTLAEQAFGISRPALMGSEEVIVRLIVHG